MTTTRGRFDYRDPDQHADYIGRRDAYRNPPRWAASEWANPFKVDTPARRRDGTREEVVSLYLTRLYCTEEGAALLARLAERRGRCQRCFCGPDELCHGDVLVALAEDDVHHTA